jgi:hypothetical protein
MMALGALLLVDFTTRDVRGVGTVQGTTTGSSVSVTGDFDVTAPETVTASTIDISYFTTCPYITAGITKGGFGAYNFVFAGQGVAANIPNIDPADFTVSQYAPWVINNNATDNFVSGPDKVSGTNTKHHRDLTKEDAGGANIVISYNPKNAGDPTNINFLQAYISNTNNGGFDTGTIDNGTATGPFYNEKSVSGTGTTKRTGTIPLVSAADTAAWIVDIPYTPEKGDGPVFADETINKETVTFQTFISGEKVISGTTYNVLYGGIQWGYTFTTVDIPEPATLTLLSVIGSVVFFGYGRPRRVTRT